MAVKRCLSMSHTQITCLLLGFILIFQPVSLSQFHGIPPGYCPGWNFTRSEHDIVSASFQVLAFDSEEVLDISCTNYFKNWRNFFFAMSATLQKHWRPKGHDESSLLFVVHLLHFNSVRRGIYVGDHVGFSYWPIWKVGSHFFFIFTPGLEVFRFLIVSPIQILLCCFSSLVFKLVIKEAIISYRHTNQISHLKNYNFTRTI